MVQRIHPSFKIILLVGFSFLTLFFIFFYISRNLSRSKASQAKVNITYVPTSTSIQLDEQKTFSIILQTDRPENKISGFDLYFKVNGYALISNIGVPTLLQNIDGSLFTRLVSDKNRISYIVNRSSSLLPNAVKIQLTIVGVTMENSVSVEVDKTKSRVTGNIPGNLYSF